MIALPLLGRASGLRVILPLLVLLVILAGCSSDSVPAPHSATAGTTRVWVNLRSRPHLEAAADIADFTARGQFVVDELQRNAAESQGPLIAFLQQRNLTFKPFWITNSIVVDADDETRRQIAAMPDVESIEPEREIALDDPETTATANPDVYSAGLDVEWNVSRTNAPKVWDSRDIQGQGIVVGVVDTGYAFHPALDERYRGYRNGSTPENTYNWADFVPKDRAACINTPCDGNGHGTHVTGTVLGRLGNHVYGVAPGAQFISCRALNDAGAGLWEYVVSCYQWFLAPTRLNGGNADASRRPNIISASLGGGSPVVALGEANTALVAAGILSVAAAGNNGGCKTVGYPGGYSDTLTVGALANKSSTIATFSSGGPSSIAPSTVKPDVVAGGENVTSTWLSGGYKTISGTSMATPAVSGVAAVVMSAVPYYIGKPSELKTLLQDTANRNVSAGSRSCGAGYPNNVTGYGEVDAWAAVQKGLLVHPQMPSAKPQ